MSNFKAIAGVSTSLKTLLRDCMEDQVPVTIAPPDVKIDTFTGKRLNLYLYQVSENGYLKNQEIPGQGHPGAYGHPPLSLDLHYLITAYGSSETTADADLEAQQILGDAMRVLHDYAIITPDLHEDDNPTKPQILDTRLLSEFERIKITLQPMILEDFSKIWTALPQANFRRSVAYQVSVVQIESQRPRRFPRLVGEPPPAGPRIVAISFRSPHIQEICVRRAGDPPGMERPYPYARIGDTLIIRGRNISSETTRVVLGTVDATAQIAVLRDDSLEVSIPDNLIVQPGSLTVKVVLNVLMGEPPTPHMGFQSNMAVFMLVPHLAVLTPNLAATPRTLQLTGTRLFHPDLECLTLVGDEVIRSEEYTTKTPTTISFNLPDLPSHLGSGNYAVRVRVNGAESINDRILNIP
jgi:hypothetical protein